MCAKVLLIPLAVALFLPLGLMAQPDSPQAPEPTAAEKETKLFGQRGPTFLSLTLDECIHRALTYGPELQVADYSIQQILEKKNETQKIGHPIINYEYDAAPVPHNVSDAVNSFFTGDWRFFNRFKMEIGVPLHTFGKVKLGREIADEGIAAEREKKNQKKSELALRIKQLYYGILLAREVNHLLTAAHDQIRDEIKKREEQESSDPTELLKLKLFREEVDKRIAEGDKKEILAKEALGTMLGLKENVQFDLAVEKLRPVEATVKDFQDYRREAIASRSDLKQLQIGYNVREKQLALEKRLISPNLGVGAFFEIGRAPGVIGVTPGLDDFTSPFNYTRAGIGLRLEGQFDLHSSFSKIRQAQTELYKVDVQKNLAEDGVELEVKEAYLDVKNTKMEMDRAEEAGKMSRQLVFLTQSNFDIGLADSKDLVDAVSSFLETRGRYFETVYNYNVALGKLEQKTGRLP